MDAKTERKLLKAQASAIALVQNGTTQDLVDWLVDTEPADWDAYVMRNHARTLEAVGCHLRRLLADLESAGIID